MAHNSPLPSLGGGESRAFNGHGECFIEIGDGKAGFGSGNFYAEPAPQVRLPAAGLALAPRQGALREILAVSLVLKEARTMCELLGISSSRPVNAQDLLHAFRRRGGEDADNPDGWGLAFLHDDRFTLHKEPLPAAHSQRLMELADSVQTELLIATCARRACRA